MTTPRVHLEVDNLTVNSAVKTKKLTSDKINSVGGGEIQLGRSSNAYADNSIAIGVSTSALGEDSIAIGSGTGYYYNTQRTLEYITLPFPPTSYNFLRTYSGQCSASGNGAIALGPISVNASGDNSIAINTGLGSCTAEGSGEVNISTSQASQPSYTRLQTINGTNTVIEKYSHAENGATVIGNRFAYAKYSSSSGKGGIVVGHGFSRDHLNCISNGDNSLSIGVRLKNAGDYSIFLGSSKIEDEWTEDNTLKIYEDNTPLDLETKLVANETVLNLSDNGNSNNINMPNSAAAAMEVNLGGTVYKIPLYL